METKHTNREEWLQDGAARMREILFSVHGHEVPEFKVSVGVPVGSRGRNKAIGQAWPAVRAEDSIAQVFISPELSEEARVLDVLAHEMIHVLYPEAGHKGPFKRVAKDIGLEGKMTATTASEDLNSILLEIVNDTLGAYPHAKLDLSKRKKQGTRNPKVMCMNDECQFLQDEGKPYKVNMSNATFEAYAPICGACEIPMEQAIEESEGE